MLSLRFASDTSPALPPDARVVNVWRDDEGREIARALTGGGRLWIDWIQIGVFTFHPASPVVVVTPRPGVPRSVVEVTFQRALQPVILQTMGRQALHASAVMAPTGVLAFCGRGGTGKSTLAFALAQAGSCQVADDAVVLTCDPERVLVHPLPFAPQLRPAARAFFGAAAAELDTGLSRRAAVGTPNLAAVFVLAPGESAGSHPRLRQMKAIEAFPVLLSHAHCFDASHRAGTHGLVEACLDIAARIPVFDLQFAPKFDGLPALVATVLGAVPDRRRSPLSLAGA